MANYLISEVKDNPWARVHAPPRPEARPCRVGPFPLKMPAMQAGLAGYSDMAMRTVARRRGCPYAITEALLDRVLLSGGRGREKGLVLSDEDHPAAGQIIGSEADEMAAAAKIVLEAGFDAVDLNFACPVKKVMGRCRGGYLLSDPDQARQIMRQVRDAVPGPLTIKLRRALDDSAQAADWFSAVFNEAVALNFSAIAVHGRTVEQKYTGWANWDFLRKLKQDNPAPVLFGSGDVFTADDARRMLCYTGVDGVWIARGAIGNPWIFSEFAALCRGDPLPEPPTVYAQRDALLEHFSLAVQIYGEESASRQMRKIGIKYSKLHPCGPEVWRAFINAKNQRDWNAALERYYAQDGPGVRVGSVPDAQDVCNIDATAAARV